LTNGETPLRERVLAIVNLIAQYVMGAEDTHISEQELITELMAVGYEAEEINDAFTWMETIALHPASDQEASEPMMLIPTYRAFSDQEQQQLTSEAQGFLVKVRAMGLLSNDAQEEIIDRATRAAEDAVTEQEIKLITILILLSRSNSLWIREIDCFLENDWARIYH
jgi:Smg protein